MAELLVADLAPLAMGVAHVRLDFLEGSEALGRPQVAANRPQRIHRHEGADVVHHEPAHGARGLGRKQHSQQASHGGTDPLDLLHAEVRDQRVDVGEELPEVIGQRRREPIALAAPGHVDADDARVCGERAGDEVEVARVAAITVRADDDTRGVVPSPLGVMKRVEPGRPQRPVRMVPGLGALRFESIPRYGPLQERVGFDDAAFALGVKAAA